MSGFFGQILRVDLSKGSVQTQPLDLSMVKDYLGGTGFATKILYDELPTAVDPLGPENKLVFMTGPFTGTNFPTSSSVAVATVSPLTGIWLDCTASTPWANSLKKTGFDGLIIEGASPAPVYLAINDDGAELRPAGDLWGLDTFATMEAIRVAIKDKRASVAVIGPAGERKVLLADIITDEGRSLSRGGAGAVMGSKNLKAIVARGSKATPLAREAEFRPIADRLSRMLATSPATGAISKHGTATMMDTAWVFGQMPAHNFRKALSAENAVPLGGKRLTDTYNVPRIVCPNFPVRCVRTITIDEGPYAFQGLGPEYEALAMLGGNCGNTSLEGVAYANQLCIKYGLDPISVGSAIAFAMTATAKGVLSKEDAGGLTVAQGNLEATLALVEQIGKADGLGALLGQGVRKASAKIGKGSEDYAIHVKGLEVPPFDPRANASMAVNYATGPRGACHFRGYPMRYEQIRAVPEFGVPHRQGRHDKGGKGHLAKVAQDMAAIMNSLVICPWAEPVMVPTHLLGALSAATGQTLTVAQLIAVGERITNLQRLFNVRLGIGRAQDRLPKRLMEPQSEGPNPGYVPDLEFQLTEYYAARGWTDEGIPGPEKLAELGLDGAFARLGAPPLASKKAAACCG